MPGGSESTETSASDNVAVLRQQRSVTKGIITGIKNSIGGSERSAV